MFIQICELDLTQPIQPIYVDYRYSRLFVIVRWGDCPLGMLRLQCRQDDRVFTPAQLEKEILQAFGWVIWEQGVAGNLNKSFGILDQDLPPISVIVCTRDRPLSLDNCLSFLSRLDYPKYEVIVVDNHSRGNAVADVARKYEVCCVREEQPGLDRARNRGIQEAKNEIIAFIDDDAKATPGWLRGIALGFAHPDVKIVTGMVLPAELETEAQCDFEIYGGMNKGFASYQIHRDRLDGPARFWASSWGVGTNMAFRKELFDQVGYFDVALDVGTPTNGAGDIEFFFRAVEAGNLLHYEASARVYHTHRRDRTGLMTQIYNNGRSFPAYLLTAARNFPELRTRVLGFGLRNWLWDWLIKRLFMSILRRDWRTARFAGVEMRGALSSLGAYHRSRRLEAEIHI